MVVLKLRPHHINCLFFYEGKGYSQGFVENMDHIVASLRENPDQVIVLEKEADLLCKVCPHLRGRQCRSAERIEQLDERTLQYHGLKEHQSYVFSDIIQQIYQNYTYDAIEVICHVCEWYKSGVCTKEKLEERKATWTLL